MVALSLIFIHTRTCRFKEGVSVAGYSEVAPDFFSGSIPIEINLRKLKMERKYAK